MLLGNENTTTLLQMTEQNNNDLTVLNKDITSIELTNMTEQKTEQKDAFLL